MAHLKKFGVGNFRAFKDLYHFDFAPITVLTGTNSSGKSSLTKAMLLFKKSYSAKDGLPSLDRLEFSPQLQIGNFNTAVNNASGNNEITMELPCRITLRCLSTIKLYYIPDSKLIRNGKLQRLEIYNNDDKSVFLTYSCDGNEAGLKVDFAVLYKMALHDTGLRNEYEDFKTKLHDLMSNLKIEKFVKSKSQYYPLELIELHKKVKDLEYVSYSFHDNDTHLGNEHIYFRSHGGGATAFPIFDYRGILNVINPDLNQEMFNYLKSEDYSNFSEYQQKCESELEQLRTFADKSNDSVVEYLIKKELETLNNFLFKDATRYEQNDGTTLLGCIQSLNIFLSGFPIFDRNMQFEYTDWLVGTGDIYKKKGNGYEAIPTGEGDPFIQACEADLGEFIIDRLFIDKIERNSKRERQPRNSKWFLIEYIQGGLNIATKILDEVFESVAYLPSVRSDISRRYKIGEEHTELQRLLNQFFKSNLVGVKSSSFIDKYISEFNIADKVEFVIADDNYDSRVTLYKDDKQFDLADVGYGYSQLLPIILKIGLLILQDQKDSFYRNSNSILIIEEPETNLHPALQSKLADMFIECYKKFNIQLIIETHSEYLIRRLQRRTAEFYNEKKKNDLSIPCDFTKIYYFYPPDNVPEGEKQVYKIEIEKDGALTKNFGTGFFDEAGNEDLLLYQIAKHNRN